MGKRDRLCGEASDINLTTAEIEIQKHHDVLSFEGYKPDCILKMDETGLFFKTILHRT